MTALIHYFKIFYKYTGIKIFLFTLLVLIGNLIDGFGLSIALPILEFGGEPDQRSQYSNFIYDSINTLGFDVTIISLVILVMIVFFIKALFKLTQEVVGSVLFFNLWKELRVDIVNRYKRMKYSFFTNTDIGFFNNIIATEIGRTTHAFRLFTVVIVSMVSVLVYLSYSFLLSWEISVAAVVLVFLIYYLFQPLVKRIGRLSKTLVKSNARLQNAFIQFILNFKYLKATSSFKNPVNKLMDEIQLQKKKGFKLEIAEKISPILLELLSLSLFSLGVIYLSVIKGYSLPSMMVTIVFLYRTLLRVPQFQGNFQRFMTLSASVDTVEDARETLTKNIEVEGREIVSSFSGSIEIENLNFSYKKTPILFDLSMSINKNALIGIVGESGCGKSTVVDIITGLLVPQSGSISIDGKDYRSLNKEALRRLFGYVTQEPVLFNDSIYNNVTLWSDNDDIHSSLERINKACEIANCTEFIEETENGYKSIVGDRGIRLSGGQGQRLAIARELYRDTEIIIFDEATSSLDSKAESLIQRSIDNLTGEKTIVIIAHRLSTVRNCDYIYVLNKGRIVQEGNWDDLISDSNSIFSKMCQLQGINN